MRSLPFRVAPARLGEGAHGLGLHAGQDDLDARRVEPRHQRLQVHEAGGVDGRDRRHVEDDHLDPAAVHPRDDADRALGGAEEERPRDLVEEDAAGQRVVERRGAIRRPA